MNIIYPFNLFFTQKQIEILYDVGIAHYENNNYYIDNMLVIIIPEKVGEFNGN